jgi:hypothetical protein
MSIHLLRRSGSVFFGIQGKDMPSTSVIVRVSINNSALATGVATRVSGRCVEVSVLSATARRLHNCNGIDTGSEAQLIFHSPKYGESPRLTGTVKSQRINESSTEWTIEVEDWMRLAEFWESVRRH